MKFGVLRSVVHNAADSLASGMGFPIGVYQMDVYAEAGRSPGGVIEVDFLSGRILEGQASFSFTKAVTLYREAFFDLCVGQGVAPTDFKTAIARFGTDAALGPHFTVTVESQAGRRAVERFVGTPGRRF